MKNLKAAIDLCFNWKKHPTSILLIAVPLFLLGMILAAAYAALKIVTENNWAYAIMFGMFLIPATLGLMTVVDIVKKETDE